MSASTLRTACSFCAAVPLTVTVAVEYIVSSKPSTATVTVKLPPHRQLNWISLPRPGWSTSEATLAGVVGISQLHTLRPSTPPVSVTLGTSVSSAENATDLLMLSLSKT